MRRSLIDGDTSVMAASRALRLPLLRTAQVATTRWHFTR